MNIIFTAQSRGLKIFYELLQEIKEPLEIQQVGFYVAQSLFYEEFCKEHKQFEKECIVLKEWENINCARSARLDLARLGTYEKAYGREVLWDAIVCDRRLYLGKWCKVKQDYRSQFSHQELLKILQVGIERCTHLINTVKPDLVFSLDPVTYGDYLIYLVCKARQIPMLFFRTTKIGNYVEWHDDVFGCSHHTKEYYNHYCQNVINDEFIEKATVYLNVTQKAEINYEGMIPVSRNTPHKKVDMNLLRRIIRLFRQAQRRCLKHGQDHHVPGVLYPSVYKKLIVPIKIKCINLKYKRQYISRGHIGSMKYALYPLQSEPEISSLIWGKAYMNQIETVRQIARSLPVGVKLLVKEHPRARGYRSCSYYQKLLDIPGVCLIDPSDKIRPYILHASIVISIATFVAFESVIYKVPSIMLGGPRPFCILPREMIRYVDNINCLAYEIKDLIENYQYQERPLLNYIAATMKGSVSINYFTALLQKTGRIGSGERHQFHEEIRKMADYTIHRCQDIILKQEVILW